MNACLFNMLHDCADYGNFSIRDAVNIYLESVFQESVNKDRSLRTCLDSSSDIPPQVIFLIDYFHRPPPQNKGWPNKNRITYGGCDVHGFLFVGCGAARRLVKPKAI